MDFKIQFFSASLEKKISIENILIYKIFRKKIVFFKNRKPPASTTSLQMESPSDCRKRRFDTKSPVDDECDIEDIGATTTTTTTTSDEKKQRQGKPIEIEKAILLAKLVLAMSASTAEVLGIEKRVERKDIDLLSEKLVEASRHRQLTKETGHYFQHTSFGCMSDPLVAHFEPSLKCGHGCKYCYAVGYMSMRQGNAEIVENVKEEKLVKTTRAKALQLIEKMTKLKTKTPRQDMLPEMHFSMSSDSFAPDVPTQTRAYIVMREWLGMGLLCSIVTKGVPANPELREKFLSLMKQHPEAVSFQCTYEFFSLIHPPAFFSVPKKRCASTSKEKQAAIEPGAPTPKERLAFLADVIAVGVKRYSLRMNPLIPGHNDDNESIAATLDAANELGVKSIAVSHIYGTHKINAALGKAGFGHTLRYFKTKKSPLHGGANKYHVLDDRRRAVLQFAIDYAKEKGYGMTIRACGCDNADIFPAHACGICWRSGGAEMHDTMERPQPKVTEAAKKPTRKRGKKMQS
jgi:DNA repair photolyase